MIVTVSVLGFCALLCLVLGGIFLNGKGVGMINMPAERKAEWDEKELCRFVGRFMIFLTLCLVLLLMSIHLGWRYLEITGFVLVLIGSFYVISRLLTPVKKKTNKTK